MSPTIENLHRDLVVAILLRLPVKYLFRCQAVCKSFRALIKSHDFIDLKNQSASNIQQGDDDTSIFIFQYPHKTHPDPNIVSYIITEHTRNYYSFHDQTFTTNVHVQFPFHTSTSSNLTVPVGCCRGLLCLVDSSNVYLWNPAIRICKNVKICYREPSSAAYQVVFGFGYAPRTKDFKVVRIKREIAAGVGKVPHEVDVYTLSSNSWRRIDDNVSGRVELYPTAIVDGNVHWMAKVTSEGGNQVYPYILCFCLEDEVFHDIALPKVYTKFRVFDYKGLLSITCYRDNACDIWVMKDYGNIDSWSKIVTFTHNNNALWLMTKNDELLVRKLLGKFSICDSKSGKVIRELQLKDFTTLAGVDSLYTVVFNYKESLVLYNHEEEPNQKEMESLYNHEEEPQQKEMESWVWTRLLCFLCS